MSDFGDEVAMAASVRPGSTAVFHFRSKYRRARCIGIRIATEAGELLVSSVEVDGVEQLLGEGVPAELFGAEPLMFDRQNDCLVLTIENKGTNDAHAGVAVEFVEEQITAVTKLLN